MDDLMQVLRSLPDTVIITDVYWYVLDYNHSEPFDRLKKGVKLKRYMPDCIDIPDDEFRFGGKVYQRKITPIYEKSAHVGYTVYLSDITEMRMLLEQRRQKNAELKELTQKQKEAKNELEKYAHQVEALSEYTEQLRIARNIHDDSGHAITSLHTISQMCLQCRESDPVQFAKLIDYGIVICENAAKEKAMRRYASLRELLEAFRNENPFPVEFSLYGEEPLFVASIYEIIHKVCKEAYHNTLSHSLADRLYIEAYMGSKLLKLRLFDNGRFHGTFEKGFGLNTMEKNVVASGGVLYFHAVEGAGFEIIAEWRAIHE